MIEIIKNPKEDVWENLLKRPEINFESLIAKVSKIISDVKLNKDLALKKYALEFDKVSLNAFKVSQLEIDSAKNAISEDLKNAILQAKNNIQLFHKTEEVKTEIIETSPGVNCWKKTVAIEKVGLYIPGGSAPLFSTVLMLGIPAKIAGCKEICLCTPPDKDGKINPAILYTASLVGITSIFKIGGAQAIAAMAFGTQSIPQVSKIFGPGNQYVTCAKQLVSNAGTAIDMPAGPSELAVLADESAIPSFVAADLLSQAEHGEDSQVILVSTNMNFILSVIKELEIQVELLPRKEITKKALLNSKAIFVENIDAGMNLLNYYAPEHLILAVNESDKIVEKVINAGSVFLGNYSCESAGDYASGTNHTLPTNGNAKAYSGVSTSSFTKTITIQMLSQEGLQNIGSTIEIMAKAEGLEAHKNAVTIRLKK